MAQETAAHAATAGPAAALGEGSGAPPGLRTCLAVVVDDLAEQIVALSQDIHAHPETGYKEHYAVVAVAELLRTLGIAVEAGVFGMDTALRAQVGLAPDGAAPTIVILADYDALPGIGHGCGHHVMCASSVGVFLALVAPARTDPAAVPGRVVLQTTPTEENSIVKEVLALRGMLDGVEAAIQTHS